MIGPAFTTMTPNSFPSPGRWVKVEMLDERASMPKQKTRKTTGDPSPNARQNAAWIAGGLALVGVIITAVFAYFKSPSPSPSVGVSNRDGALAIVSGTGAATVVQHQYNDYSQHLGPTSTAPVIVTMAPPPISIFITNALSSASSPDAIVGKTNAPKTPDPEPAPLSPPAAQPSALERQAADPAVIAEFSPFTDKTQVIFSGGLAIVFRPEAPEPMSYRVIQGAGALNNA